MSNRKKYSLSLTAQITLMVLLSPILLPILAVGIVSFVFMVILLLIISVFGSILRLVLLLIVSAVCGENEIFRQWDNIRASKGGQSILISFIDFGVWEKMDF